MEEYTSSQVRTLIEGELGRLESVLRDGARRMLMSALQMEVDAYIDAHKQQRDDQGQRLVVRNGSHPERDLVTGLGKIPIQQPRVHDRRPENAFSSQILPKYKRRLAGLDTWIPMLYLKGVSTPSFPDALRDLLGVDVAGLSPTNIGRLKSAWVEELQQWQQRDLTGKRYVYIWADGIYFKVRMQPEKPCALVIIGATEDGQKELLALCDGQRESTISWRELLLDLKARGLTYQPRIAVGDGGTGFWTALNEVFPETREQRCWVHKTWNLLNKLPKREQPKAKKMIHAIYGSPTKAQALMAYGQFLDAYGHDAKVRDCLEKDRDILFTFYDFPEPHWHHLRTTNVIESTFGTVRHRTRQTKGCLNQINTLAMVYKLTTEAQKRWQCLHSSKLTLLVAQGVQFQDGQLKRAA